MCSTCASGTTEVSREVTVVLPEPLRPSTAMIPGRPAGWITRLRTARTWSANARSSLAYQSGTGGSSGWSAARS